MRAGPKREVTADPLNLDGLPRSGGDRVIAFIQAFLLTPKGTGAKHPFLLRQWQKRIVRGLFDEPRPRQGLVSIPRGNGKSTLAAALGLYGLLGDGVEGAQVLTVASDERQARIVFNAARRMVELNPELVARVQVFQDRLYVPGTDSVLAPLPAEPGALQGFDPSLCIVDELHVVGAPVWEAMSLASGKRDLSLVLAISTPAADSESVMWKLVEHGRVGDDPSFYFQEFAAPTGCDVADEDAWEAANPALDDFLHRDALRATLRTSRESSFRRFRLGQWAGAEDTWLPEGAWEACVDASAVVEDGAEVCVGFDGSYNGDVTALVVASVADRPHVDVVAVWERPEHAHGWEVPIVEVEDAIRQACRRWKVREIACDPFRWGRSMQVLEAEGLPIVEFPQSAARMTPATQRLYEAVTTKAMTHSGDRLLARHVANATLKVDGRGQRLSKEHKHSTRRIDCAVALVMGFDRASQQQPDADYDVLRSVW